MMLKTQAHLQAFIVW